MIVAIGRGAGTGQRPDPREPIVDNVEGFGFVAEVMFAVRGTGLLVFLDAFGLVLPSWLEPE